MKINQRGIDLLHSFEKLRLEPYDDANGKTIHDWSKVRGYPTVGWGHKIKPEETHLRGPITKEKADEIFMADVGEAEKEVNRLVKVKLNDNQFAALVCFVFNAGGPAFAESTLLRLLNEGNHAAVVTQLQRWIYTTIHGKKTQSDGLKKRRWAERKLWLTETEFTPVLPGEPERATPKAQPSAARSSTARH